LLFGGGGAATKQSCAEQSRIPWWGKSLHLEVAADEELASHDGQLVCDKIVKVREVVGDEESEADEDEKNEKVMLSWDGKEVAKYHYVNGLELSCTTPVGGYPFPYLIWVGLKRLRVRS
jgi:hypothetical protein